MRREALFTPDFLHLRAAPPQPPNCRQLSPPPRLTALTPRARRILDFEKYDQMVSGVNHCANYAQCDDGGLRTIKSAYQIQALHMKFNYFMEHTYDPAQQCLTFHLDYDRKSDLDDSVEVDESFLHSSNNGDGATTNALALAAAGVGATIATGIALTVL